MTEPGPADALDVHAEISQWTPPAGYDGTQRYLDFRAVFIDGGATAEQARRVLNQVMWKCGVLRSPIMVNLVGGDDKAADATAVDTIRTFTRLGEQNIGRWLLAQIAHQPRSEPLPEQAISEEPD